MSMGISVAWFNHSVAPSRASARSPATETSVRSGGIQTSPQPNSLPGDASAIKNRFAHLPTESLAQELHSHVLRQGNLPRTPFPVSGYMRPGLWIVAILKESPRISGRSDGRDSIMRGGYENVGVPKSFYTIV